MTETLTPDELPACTVCHGQAVYLAYIRIRVGPHERRSWEPVCVEHRRRFIAYRLIKGPADGEDDSP